MSGIQYNDLTPSGSGPITIAVGPADANTSTQPLSPLSELFLDPELTEILPNPLTLAGNSPFSFFVSPGSYIVQLYGPHISTQLRTITVGSNAATPATKILYVDKGRTDSYIPTGTPSFPFKTIADAVAQVATNGDNTLDQPYLIDIIGPGWYNETIDLSAAGLVNLVFEGHSAVRVGPDSGLALNCAGNPGLLSLTMNNLSLQPTSGNTISLTDVSNSGTFLSDGLIFFNCLLTGSGTMVFTNCGGPAFYRSQITTPLGATFSGLLSDADFFYSSWSPGGTLTLSNGSNLVTRGTALLVNVVIGSGCGLFTRFSQVTGNITINGTFQSEADFLGSNITVNNGGAATSTSARAGMVTVNAGGTYTPTNLVEAGQFTLPNNQVILVGSGAPAVAAPVGSLYLRTDGSTSTTLYVKESGTGTSGWVAK